MQERLKIAYRSRVGRAPALDKWHSYFADIDYDWVLNGANKIKTRLTKIVSLLVPAAELGA